MTLGPVLITGQPRRTMCDRWSHEDAGNAATDWPPAPEIIGPTDTAQDPEWAVDGGCKPGKPESNKPLTQNGFCSIDDTG